MAETLIMGDFKAQLDDAEANEIRTRFREGGPGLTNLALPRNVHGNLAAALANVQAECPEVVKSERAKIDAKEGRRSYEYSYADLAAVTRAVLPILGKNGLAWITMPTLHEGRMVLLYKLVHASGDAVQGFYPLPDRGSPQDMGGAITYARRYALCAVTGVAPDDDDDDAAAATAAHRRGQLSTPPISEYEARTGLALLTPPTDEARNAVTAEHAAAAFQQSLDFRRCLHEKGAWEFKAPNATDDTTWGDLFRSRIEAEISAATTPDAWRLVRKMLDEAELGRAYAKQLQAQADRIKGHQQELVNHLTSILTSAANVDDLGAAGVKAFEAHKAAQITDEQYAALKAVGEDRHQKLSRQHRAEALNG